MASAARRPLITEAAKSYLEHHLRLAGRTIGSYAALSAPAKAKAIATIRPEKRYMCALEPGDVPMTHAEAVAEVRQWIDAKSLSLHRLRKGRERREATSLPVGATASEESDQPLNRRTMAGLTAKDAPLLRKMIPAICSRLSVEAIEELRQFPIIHQHLVRSGMR